MRRLLLRGTLILLGFLLAAELLLQLAGLYTRWRYQHDEVLLRPGTVRILCLGDSNTYGLYLPREQSWPGQLQALLDASEPGRYQVINLGVPATPSFRILENLPNWLQTLQPDHVILLVGVNDLLFGSRPGEPSANTAWRESWRALRLVRLARLWTSRRAAPDVQHADDQVQQTLDRLPQLPSAEAVVALAELYRPHAERIDAIDLVQEGEHYWLQGFGHRISLNAVAEALRSNPDGFQRYQQYMATARQLLAHAPTGFQLPAPASLHINEHAFNLNPLPLSPDHEAIRANLRAAAMQTRQHGIHLLLLSYASNTHFYGQANHLLRQLASRDNLPFLDMADHVQAHCDNPECNTLFFPDQHPNAEGYRLMAERIAEHLLQGTR